jgi:hypothetical protein
VGYNKRDSKDPMPNKENSCRTGKDGGGNTPVTGEKHNQKKAERVTVASRFDDLVKGPEQPTRNDNGDGNTPVNNAKETHDSKKAERISASKRF